MALNHNILLHCPGSPRIGMHTGDKHFYSRENGTYGVRRVQYPYIIKVCSMHHWGVPKALKYHGHTLILLQAVDHPETVAKDEYGHTLNQ